MISRVHWLLWNLDSRFKGYYKLLFDYRYHNYLFYHNYSNFRSKRLKECFIVIRSSKRCFRVMYYDDARSFFAYRTFKSSLACASWMLKIGYPRHEVD